MNNLPFYYITNKVSNLPIKMDKIANEYGVMVDNKFLGVRYYEVETSIEKKLLKQFIHPQARKFFHIALMVINHHDIPPHIDNDLNVVLNYYIETADATTKFWNAKNDKLTTTKIKNQNNGRLFDKDELECIGNFKANSNDMWMLDVSKIHSVEAPINELRIAYCFQSNKITYSDIIKNVDKYIL
jgi:hypothetical protein